MANELTPMMQLYTIEKSLKPAWLRHFLCLKILSDNSDYGIWW